MNSIGIIRAGSIGRAFATALARSNIGANLSNSPGPDSLREVIASLGPSIEAGPREEAASKDIVFFAVDLSKLPAALKGLPDFGGRIVNHPIEGPLFRPTELGGGSSIEVFAYRAWRKGGQGLQSSAGGIALK